MVGRTSLLETRCEDWLQTSLTLGPGFRAMAAAKKPAPTTLQATPRRKAPAPAKPATPAPAASQARMPPAPTPAAKPAHAPRGAPELADGPTNGIGHYGWRAIALAVLGVAALVVHLAVPYQVFICDGDAFGCPDDKTISRKDHADTADTFDEAWVDSAGPGLTMAGAIVLLVGGLALTGLGFVPMPVTAARWAGWLGGLVAFAGAWFTASSSLYWIGDWASALLNLGNPGGPDFILLLSPLIVGGAGIAAVLLAIGIMRDVITTRDGLREEARHTLAVAKWSLLSLGLVLLVPWSFYNPEGDSYQWHSALGILFQHGVADSFGSFGAGGDAWNGMSYALVVLTVTCWIAAFAGVVVSAGGLLAHGLMPPRWLPLLHGLSLFMTAWSAILYVLMWAYMWKPTDGADDFLPGFFPAFVLAGFIPLAWSAIDQVRDGARSLRGNAPASRPNTVRFD